VSDGRSVADLLLDADLTARAALWDPDPGTAKARVRTWGEVVEAAADLWAAIPARAGESGGDPVVGPGLDRVHRLTQALVRTHRRSGWPPPGPGDPHLESVAASLARAAGLVSERHHPSDRISPAGHRDADAARARIMHVLYVSAHGVVASLERHTRDLTLRPSAGRVKTPGESLAQARDTWRRVGAVEGLVGSYLGPRWPGTLAGEHRPAVGVPALEQALARWDVAAHRSLAGSPTMADLARITEVQADLATATGVVTSAAAQQGLLDPRAHAERTEPALARLEAAWGQFGTDLRALAGRHRRVDHDLLLVGNEVRAMVRDVTHDGAGVATPAVMSARVDLGGAVVSLQRGLTCAVDLAHVVRDVAGDPGLTGSARGVHAALSAAAGVARGDAAWVPVEDLHHDRPVPLPHVVRAVLLQAAARALDHAIVADSAVSRTQPPHATSPSAQLDTLAGAPSVNVPYAPTQLSGRRGQTLALPPPDPNGRARGGCER